VDASTTRIQSLETSMRRSFLAAAFAVLAITGASGAWAQAPAPIVIKFSHVVAPDTPKGMAATKFKELAEQRTNGRVKVDVYPNSALYKDGEEMEALQLGAVQMLAPSVSKFGPLGAPQFEVFDLPYIFPNRDVLHRVTLGPVGRDLFKLLEPKGIVGLAYWDNGFKMMSANKPLHLPADYKGLKMRIKSSKVLESQTRALGALPQVLAFSEVYQAMQTGVVDGSENTLPNFYTQKFYEVQKFLALTSHGYDGYAVIVNKKFWDGLPPDIRKILADAMTEASVFENTMSDKFSDEALAKIKASNRTEIYQPTEAENAALKQALVPVQKEMEARIGKKWIDAIHGEEVALEKK
jgi:C4-dicarboxylate-binding protein DctP